MTDISNLAYEAPSGWTVLYDRERKWNRRVRPGVYWCLSLRRHTGQVVTALPGLTRDEAWALCRGRMARADKGLAVYIPGSRDDYPSDRACLPSVGMYIRTGRQGLYLHSTDGHDPAGRVLTVDDARALTAFIAEHLPALGGACGE